MLQRYNASMHPQSVLLIVRPYTNLYNNEPQKHSQEQSYNQSGAEKQSHL